MWLNIHTLLLANLNRRPQQFHQPPNSLLIALILSKFREYLRDQVLKDIGFIRCTLSFQINVAIDKKAYRFAYDTLIRALQHYLPDHPVVEQLIRVYLDLKIDIHVAIFDMPAFVLG